MAEAGTGAPGEGGVVGQRRGEEGEDGDEDEEDEAGGGDNGDAGGQRDRAAPHVVAPPVRAHRRQSRALFR